MFEGNIDCAGAVSFAELEAKEAHRFSKLLAEVEDRLYTPCASNIVNERHPEKDNIRQYYSEGYDANYESVGDIEIRQWQRTSCPNMIYIRAEGCGINVPKGRDEFSNTTFPCDNETERKHFVDDMDSISKLNDDLFICGKSIVAPAGFTPHHMRTTSIGGSEYVASHGILQEYIEYSGDHHSVCIDSIPINNEQCVLGPQDSQKEEVLSSMVDAIWPDIVHALKPLITDVLTAARENNIPYQVNQTPIVPVEEYEDGGFDFASDSEW